MRLPRLTIAALMVWVAYLAALIAAFVAAYREPSETTAGVACGVVLASLCLAALLAVVRRGRARGAWAGMAIFGLGYLAFAWSADGAPPPPTTTAIDHAWAGSIVFDMPGAPQPRGFVQQPTAHRIGHALCTLAIGHRECSGVRAGWPGVGGRELRTSPFQTPSRPPQP
jgi:hypothetical protein